MSARNIVKEAVDTIENDRVQMASHLLTFGFNEEFVNLISKCNEEEIEGRL